MRKLFAAVAIVAPLASMPAFASCTEGGFLYVWETCVQETVPGAPGNICEIKKGKDPKVVLFTSNIVYLRPNNRRYPNAIFFDEIQLQHSVTINGRESICFATRREAEDDLRAFKADRKRGARGEIVLVSVSMPNP